MCDLQLRKVITFSSEFRFGFLDSMENPLSQISICNTLEGSGCLIRTEMAVQASKVGCPGEAA